MESVLWRIESQPEKPREEHIHTRIDRLAVALLRHVCGKCCEMSKIANRRQQK